MKTTIVLTGILMLLFCGNAGSTEATGKSASLNQGTVTVMCTPDLYQLTSTWADKFSVYNPGIKVEVLKSTSENSDLDVGNKLSFVSAKSQVNATNDKRWQMVIGRDIIVPVVNAENPYLNSIQQQGISAEQFSRLFNNSDQQDWKSLVSGIQTSPVHIYMVDDESVKSAVVKFLQMAQFPVNGLITGTKDETISAIQKDPYAIGFCRLVNILGTDDQSLVENIRLLPIDRNGNGTIDHMEDIYGDLNDFMRGVWIGKYPKDLYSNIYAINEVQPVQESEQAFLSWVLTDGQKYMISNGYCDLAGSESQSQLDKLNTAVISVSPTNDTSQAGLILLIVAGLIIGGFIIGALIRRYRKQESVLPDFNNYPATFDENSVIVPKGLYFDKTHTWAFMEKDGNVTIGIDDFLQHITGPVTRIEMKNPGDKIRKGDLLFSIIQSGKQLNLFAPVSGTIKKHNEVLISDSSFINSSPYVDGWVYRIEPANWIKEIQFMDMADKYTRWINNEFSRVKDFLAATLKPESLEFSHVVMQDGGVLKEGILADLGPEVWDDFQTNFLDTYNYNSCKLKDSSNSPFCSF
jgi:glycine cleavage system H lipoate-binding protein/ABC-type phosphate transport system substrate-binding protein